MLDPSEACNVEVMAFPGIDGTFVSALQYGVLLDNYCELYEMKTARFMEIAQEFARGMIAYSELEKGAID
jgi:hypothetical protein